MRFSLLIVSALAAALFATAAAGEASGDFDAEIRRGAALMQAGGAEEAFALFSELRRQTPGDAAAILWQARAAAATGRRDVATRNIEALLAAFPDHPVLRREAHELYSSMGDGERAAALPPSSPLTSRQMLESQVMRDLQAEASRYGRLQPRTAAAPQARTRFFGRLSAGILWDSNANQGPASSLLQLGQFLVEVENRKKTSTMAAYLGAYFGFSHRLSENGPWLAVGDLNLYARGNARSILKETDNREWQSGRVSAGVAYANDRNYFEARGKFEVFDNEFKSRVLASGLELSYSRAVTDNFHLISRAGLEWRDYYRSSYRNGLYRTAGQYARFFWGCPDEAGRRHWFMLGARYYGAGAHMTRFGYDAVEASARANFELPCNFAFSPHVSYSYEKYRGAATAVELVKRRDNRFRAGADLEYRITDNWSANVHYQYVRNNSKSAFYDYDQHVVGAGMSWGF